MGMFLTLFMKKKLNAIVDFLPVCEQAVYGQIETIVFTAVPIMLWVMQTGSVTVSHGVSELAVG